MTLMCLYWRCDLAGARLDQQQEASGPIVLDGADSMETGPTSNQATDIEAAAEILRRKPQAHRKPSQGLDVMCISDSEDASDEESDEGSQEPGSSEDDAPSTSAQQQQQQRRTTRDSAQQQQQQQGRQHRSSRTAPVDDSSGSDGESDGSGTDSSSQASSSDSESDNEAAEQPRTRQHTAPTSAAGAGRGRPSKAQAAGGSRGAGAKAASTPRKGERQQAAAVTPSRPVRTCTQTPQRSTRAGAAAASTPNPSLATPLGKLSLGGKGSDAPGSTARATRSSSRLTAPAVTSTRKASAAAAATPSKQQQQRQTGAGATAATPKAKRAPKGGASKTAPLKQVVVEDEVILPGDDLYLQLDDFEDIDSEDEEESCEVRQQQTTRCQAAGMWMYVYSVSSAVVVGRMLLSTRHSWARSSRCCHVAAVLVMKVISKAEAAAGQHESGLCCAVHS